MIRFALVVVLVLTALTVSAHQDSPTSIPFINHQVLITGISASDDICVPALNGQAFVCSPAFRVVDFIRARAEVKAE